MRSISGFSLIEVLVFVSILTVFFIIAAAIMGTSLRNMKANEHKILATHYAEELQEWLKGQKEADWQEFLTNAGQKSGDCFNQAEIAWATADTACSFNGMVGSDGPKIFKRRVTFDPGSPALTDTEVAVSIAVEWQDLGVGYSVPLNSVFTLWE